MDGSKLLRLNFKDLGKGILVAVGIVILQLVLEALKGGGIEGLLAVDWGSMLDLAAKAGGAYLLKNLFTGEDKKVLGMKLG